MDAEWYNPIVILKPELQHLLSSLIDNLPDKLRQEILNLKLEIIYDDLPLPIRTPTADLDSNKIAIQGVYLSFLWCCCYSTVVYNNMYYKKAELDEDVVSFNDLPESEKCDLTLRWARSLSKHITDWPDEAARPDKPDHWIDDAKNLFQACFAYVVLHEIGHLVYHKGLKELLIAAKNPYYEISDKDISRFKETEIEADKFALSSLIGKNKSSNTSLIVYLGATLAQLSIFYLREIPDARGGLTHPDLDDRLRLVINDSKLNNKSDQMQVQAHISVGLQLFLYLTGKDFIPENNKDLNLRDFDGLEKYLFDLISDMKIAART